MREFVALELGPDDFKPGVEPSPFVSIACAELVTYRGEVVKNRNGKTTNNLFSLLREERGSLPDAMNSAIEGQ